MSMILLLIELGGYEAGYSTLEHLRVELLGVAANLDRVIFLAVEAAHHLRQRFGRLLSEELARDAGQHRFQGSARSVSYHRAAGSLGLQWGDPEILLAREDEAFAIRVQLLEICFGDLAQEFNVRFCPCL